MVLTSARHSISRAKFYRIGDLTPEQVRAFLEKRNIPQTLHLKAYEFVGGRINQLKLFVSEMVDYGLAFEGNELS